ncbi:MAG TPA: BamA/TamA family outer membrane protein [Halanaerobiales bacterium]|nr:BamA/TamA family outer membrane protein [Halanaerobiales bacterium]
MKKRFILLVLSVLIITVMASTVISAQSQDQSITAIEIQGNENIMRSEILSEVETKVGDSFNSEQIKSDMQSIYDLGYFQDVKVNFQNFEGGLKVIFNVVENPKIQEINIEGLEVYDKAQIIDWLGVREGSILNVNKLNSGLKNVITNYQDNGYLVVNITDVNISEEGILNIVLDLGHINEIKLDGNKKTKDYVIMREIALQKGDVLNINDVREASRKIYRLNYFTDISPELERIGEDSNEVNVIFKLTEKKTGNFNFGGGYSSRDGWFGFVKVNESNLGGNGQTLGFNYQFGRNDYYNLNFFEPYFMGYPTSLGLNIYNKYTDRDDYTERSIGGSISVGHDIYRGWRGTARYKIENTTINAISSEYEDSSTELRSITFSARKDTTNYPYNPTSGRNDNLSVEFAGGLLGGDANFTKYNFDLRRYYGGFKEDHSWALRLKGGASTGILPLSEKYNLGGSDSLRGYSLYSFTGDHSLLTQVEYRMQFMDNLTGVIFVDGGQTWDKDETIVLDDLNYGYGLGVRINTAIGQIRLDYGWNEDGIGKTHFSLGNTF